MKIIPALVAFVLSVFVHPIYGARLYVDASASSGGDGISWATAFRYLQDALDQTVAGRGDEIWLTDGSYYPDQGANVTTGDRHASFHIKDGVTLYGGFAGGESGINQRDWHINRTILSGAINADEALWSLHVCHATNATFDGIEVIRGNANADDADSRSGAVVASGDIVVRNSLFAENSANEFGGVAHGGNWTVYNSTFKNNVAGFRGGVAFNGTWFVRNSTFENNAAIGEDGMMGSGGVAYGGHWDVVQCVFRNNFAVRDAGVAMFTSWAASHSVFEGNSANSRGGVLRTGMGNVVTVTNCVFISNSATLGGVAEEGDWTVVNCVFFGNSANQGAVANNGNWIAYNSIFTETNSFGGNVTFSNAGSGSFPERAKNLVVGGVAVLPQGANIGSAEWIINADPRFEDSNTPAGPDGIWGTADDGLRLHVDSPAIGQGNSLFLPQDEHDLDMNGITDEPIPIDLSGFPRIFGQAPDLGAYEFQGATQPIYFLNISAGSGGSVEYYPSAGYYPEGTEVTLTALPYPGFEFSGWSGDITSTENPVTLTMLDGDMSVTAHFQAQQIPDITKHWFEYASSGTSLVNFLSNLNTPFFNYIPNSVALAFWVDESSMELSFETLSYSAASYNFSFENEFTVGFGQVKNIQAEVTIDAFSFDFVAEPNLGHLTPYVSGKFHIQNLPNRIYFTPVGDYVLTGSYTITGPTEQVSGTFNIDHADVLQDVFITPDRSSSHGHPVLDTNNFPDSVEYWAEYSGVLSNRITMRVFFTKPLLIHETVDGVAVEIILNNHETHTPYGSATFAKIHAPTYTLSVNEGQGGSVGVSPQRTSYEHGMEVALTAIPQAGYLFEGWSGNASGSENPVTLIMNGDKSVTANFRAIIVPVLLSVSPDTTVVSGQTVLLEVVATGASAYQWYQGEGGDESNPVAGAVGPELEVAAEDAGAYWVKAVSSDGVAAASDAILVERLYILSTAASTGGSVLISPQETAYVGGVEVTLTAVADSGYVLDGWSGDASGRVNPLTMLMNGDKSVTANFRAIIVPVLLSVSPDTTVVSGQTVLLEVVATGASTYQWYQGEGGDESNPVAGAVGPELDVAAEDAGAYWVKAVSIDGMVAASDTILVERVFVLSVQTTAGGSVGVDPDNAHFAENEEVVLTAQANPGYVFEQWSGDGFDSENPLTLVMDSNKSVTAHFRAMDEADLLAALAGSDPVIILGGPVVTTAVLIIDREVTLDLNGHDLSGFGIWIKSSDVTVRNGGILPEPGKGVTGDDAFNTAILVQNVTGVLLQDLLVEYADADDAQGIVLQGMESGSLAVVDCDIRVSHHPGNESGLYPAVGIHAYHGILTITGSTFGGVDPDDMTHALVLGDTAGYSDLSGNTFNSTIRGITAASTAQFSAADIMDLILGNTYSIALDAEGSARIHVAGVDFSRIIATITLSGLMQSFDGTPKTATVTTDPVGLDVDVTYNGDAVAPIYAGEYIVNATIVDNNYSGTAEGIMAIGKGTQTIDFAMIADQPLDGGPVDLTATSSSGLAVDFSLVSGPAELSGQSLEVTGLGPVVVEATQAGDSNWAEATPVVRTFHVHAGYFEQHYVWARGFGLGEMAATGTVIVAPAADGGVFVFGDFDEIVDIEGIELSPEGLGSDMLLLKLDAAGELLWVRQFGGEGYGFARAAVAPSSGGIVLGGDFSAAIQIGETELIAAGQIDIALFKVDDSGEVVWVQHFGGSQSSGVLALASDDSGDQIYMSGGFNGSLEMGHDLLVSEGGSDGFIAALDNVGEPVWSRSMGGNGDAVARAVAVRPSGEVAVAGAFEGQANFGGLLLNSAGAKDGFAALLDATGDFLWAKRFGGPATDMAKGIAVDSSGDVWVVGSFMGADASGFGPNPMSSIGSSDAFVMQLDGTDGNPVTSAGYGGAGHTTADAITFHPIVGMMVGGSYQNSIVLGDTTLQSSGAADTFVARFHRPEEPVFALSGGGEGYDYTTGIAINHQGVTFQAGVITGNAQFGSHTLNIEGTHNIFVAKINGPLPAFAQQFADLNVPVGAPFMLGGEVYGAYPISFNWFINGEPLPQATTPVYSVLEADSSDSGSYVLQATNAYGTTYSQPVDVTVMLPQQTLSVEPPPIVGENRQVSIPVYLSSTGNVVGLTFEVDFNTDYFTSADFQKNGQIPASAVSVSADHDAGNIRVVVNTFPSEIQSGKRQIGSIRLVTRSVPADTVVAFIPEIKSISDIFGEPITTLSQVQAGEIHIQQRSIPGDVNNNNRLDVSDAAELIRLYTNPTEIRPWDHYLNDLNFDGILTEADATRVLRVVTRLDPTPSFPDAQQAQPSGLNMPLDLNSMGTISAAGQFEQFNPLSPGFAESMHASGQRVEVIRLTEENENRIWVRIFFDDVSPDQTGLFFRLNYPAEVLRIAEPASLGITEEALPADALRIWNVEPDNSYTEQSGTVSFAAAWSSAWTFPADTAVAHIVMEIIPGQTPQVNFPLEVFDAEVAPYSDSTLEDPLPVQGGSATFSRTYSDWALALLGDADADMHADADADGWTNYQEYLASTDPMSASSRFAIESNDLSGDALNIRWYGSMGVDYQVLSSDNLVDWEPDSPVIPGENAVIEYTRPLNASPQQFYKVEIK